MSKTENQKSVFSKLCLKVKSVNDSRLCGWRPWAGSITTRTLEGRLAEPAKEFFEIPTTTRESLYRISRMKKLNFLMHYLRDDLVSGYIDAVPLWTYNVSYKAYFKQEGKYPWDLQVIGPFWDTSFNIILSQFSLKSILMSLWLSVVWFWTLNLLSNLIANLSLNCHTTSIFKKFPGWTISFHWPA